MDMQEFLKTVRRGSVTDPTEIRAVIDAFGKLRMDQLYTKRMRKYNCLDSILKAAGYPNGMNESTRDLPFSEVMNTLERRILTNDGYGEGEYTPVLSGIARDALDSLSYLYFDYLASLTDD